MQSDDNNKSVIEQLNKLRNTCDAATSVFLMNYYKANNKKEKDEQVEHALVSSAKSEAYTLSIELISNALNKIKKCEQDATK